MLVKIEGLERSRFGKKRPRAPLLQRLPVAVTIKRVVNFRSRGRSCPAFNARLENYFPGQHFLLTSGGNAAARQRVTSARATVAKVDSPGAWRL